LPNVKLKIKLLELDYDQGHDIYDVRVNHLFGIESVGY